MVLKHSISGPAGAPATKKFRRGLEEDDEGDDFYAETGFDCDDSSDAIENQPGATTRSKEPYIRERKYVCDAEGCDKRFTRPSHLESHMRTHTKERPFVCPREGCDRTYTRKDHLDRHIKSEHEKQRDVVCDREGCGKRFFDAKDLKSHIAMIHENENRFYCTGYPPCNERFRKKKTLQAHINSAHLGLDPYPCQHVDEKTGEACTHGFQANASLQRHVKVAHSEEKKDDQRYCCMVCSAGTAADTMETEDDLVTPKQPLSFSTYEELLAHAKEFHPPTCTECGQQFASQGSLKGHMDIVHAHPDDIPKFHCTEPGCGSVFNKKSNLNTHVKQVHSRPLRFVCGTFDSSNSRDIKVRDWDRMNACGMPLRSKNALEQHIRTHHLGLANRKAVRQEKKEQKRRGLPEPSMLSLLTGVGYEKGRNIECIVGGCEFRFSREFDLTTHLAADHKLTEEEIAAMMEERTEKQALEGGQFWVGGLDDSTDTSTFQSVQSSVPQTPMTFPSPAYDQEPLFTSNNQQFDPKFPSLGEPMVLEPLMEDEDEAKMDEAMGLTNVPLVDIRYGL